MWGFWGGLDNCSQGAMLNNQDGLGFRISGLGFRV